MKKKSQEKEKKIKLKTAKEWLVEGITKVRLPIWNEWAYLEISHNIWWYLYDINCPGKAISKFEIDKELYAKWEEPKNFKERKNEIYNPVDFTKGEL